MYKTATMSAIEQRIAELEDQIIDNEADKKSVGRLKRQARALKVCRALIDAYAPETFSIGALDIDLAHMIKPTKGKKMVFDIKEGDSIIELLSTYEAVKDGYHKIMAQAEEMGLKMVGGVLVKA